MIIDLQKFIAEERPYWEELEAVLDRLERREFDEMCIDEVRRFHYLYERVASDLGKMTTFAFETETRRYVEALIARAYGEIHETRAKPHRFRPKYWLMNVLPSTFRRHARAFALSCLITLAGCLLGGGLILADPDAKEIFLPYEPLLQPPSERVFFEERRSDNHLQGVKARGAAWYIRHNTQVAVTTIALGATWGVGTVLMLALNGIFLGVVSVDYLMAGEVKFLLGWLLPHGAVEIPAILLAGQAGLVLANALIGWGSRRPIRDRLRQVGPDLVTLMAGTSLLLIWAGIVESFLSQYHKPTLPYALKILLGALEIVLLTLFLWRAGRSPRTAGATDPSPKTWKEQS